jgi:hypothetical protein
MLHESISARHERNSTEAINGPVEEEQRCMEDQGEANSDTQMSGLGPLCDVCTDKRQIDLDTLREVVLLATELAREGREGRKVGTMFVVSDEREVLSHSRPLILDPLWHHPQEHKHISDSGMRETAKELAQLDGAFVVSDDGVFLSACRYLDASSKDVDLPLGLGSRHMAAASVTKKTNAVAVVVSESSIVRVFDDGQIVSEIIPEIWLLQRHGLHLKGPYSTRKSGDVTIASKTE